MPSGWIHWVQDLIAFGRIYSEIHRWKDEPHKYLGQKHRIERHSLYCMCKYAGKPFESLQPTLMKHFKRTRDLWGDEKAEEEMVNVAHEHLDCNWDELEESERKYWEGFFAWVALSPEILRDWAGVDVIHGRIKRRLDCGIEIWEEAPEVIQQYEKLRKKVEQCIKVDKSLRTMLRKYGGLI